MTTHTDNPSVAGEVQHGAIRVLIVEDSPTAQRWLIELIDAHPPLRVAGVASSGEDAIEMLDRLRPDVISLDICLPDIDGIELTRRVMSHRPTPIVVCSGSIRSAESRLSMEALRAGALAAVEKPAFGSTPPHGYALCEQLVRMSSVRLVRRRFDANTHPRHKHTEPAASVGCPGAVGIVSSTGGPGALAKILSRLPADFPVPILLVQHIAPSFHDGFVAWLDTVGPLHAVTANDGNRPRPGHIHVAPPGSHTALRCGRLMHLRPAGPDINVPSGSVMLSSMATDLGPNAVGIVLTGMGDDGASGLFAIRRAGGFTVAEHASTAVVDGMPRVAVQLGAACRVLPVHQIAAVLTRACSPGRVVA